MNTIVVYHGGTERIEKPICKLGRKNLDFGQGFYITSLREQASHGQTTWQETEICQPN